LIFTTRRYASAAYDKALCPYFSTVPKWPKQNHANSAEK